VGEEKGEGGRRKYDHHRKIPPHWRQVATLGDCRKRISCRVRSNGQFHKISAYPEGFSICARVNLTETGFIHLVTLQGRERLCGGGDDDDDVNLILCSQETEINCRAQR
jgi:hypothetical protein